ncbi:MAG: transglutaminase-like domain-containing protein [Alicyclobacillaceae bacterium]|nr:transglutaminase-like domain-containing protein [Alicyclobacillaceae bacterium]
MKRFRFLTQMAAALLALTVGAGSAISLSPAFAASPVSTASAAPSAPSAADDTAFWLRAGNDLYLVASTDARLSDQGPPILSAKPGQTLYLWAYSTTRDVGPDIAWFVNSPDAAVRPGPRYIQWTIEQRKAAWATFTASKPGIYTVQARSRGTYSVPLVLIIGFEDLKAKNSRPAPTPDQAGIRPLNADLPPAIPRRGANLTVWPYQPSGGWLPVIGRASGGVESVTVVISSRDGSKSWNYTLPVNSKGVFGSSLRVPYQGDLMVYAVPDFFRQLKTQNGWWKTDVAYPIRSNAPALSPVDLARLASAWVDYRKNPEFAATASVLLDNAPSVRSGIAAVANFVSGKLRYDWDSFYAGRPVWKNAEEAWRSGSGVCQQFAEVTAALLRSVGVPAETVSGEAAGPTSGPHEWVRVWDGSAWIAIDPTWNQFGSRNNTALSNEYLTETLAFKESHIPETFGAAQ